MGATLGHAGAQLEGQRGIEVVSVSKCKHLLG